MGILCKAWDKTQDIKQDTSNLPILTLFDFCLSWDLTIYLPPNVEMKKGETWVIYESERPLKILADTWLYTFQNRFFRPPDLYILFGFLQFTFIFRNPLFVPFLNLFTNWFVGFCGRCQWSQSSFLQRCLRVQDSRRYHPYISMVSPLTPFPLK